MLPTCQVPVLDGPETVVEGEYAPELEHSRVQGARNLQSCKGVELKSRKELGIYDMPYAITPMPIDMR